MDISASTVLRTRRQFVEEGLEAALARKTRQTPPTPRIPPKSSAAFAAVMEDVLEAYTRPHDPARPLVCPDQTSKQLTKETRAPIP